MRLDAAGVLMFPMIADGLSQHFGLYGGNNELRFVTGLIFGPGLSTILSLVVGEVITKHLS